MPRIRTIKPDFFTDGKVIRVSAHARLLFIGMWNFANCDAGHVDDDPISLRFRILPADDVDVHKLISELLDVGLVERILADGEPYLYVRGLRDHQKTDARWTPRCRACSAEHVEPHPGSFNPTETHPNSPELTETHRNSAQEGKGREGREGREGSMFNDADAPSERDDSYPLDFEQFWQAYPRRQKKGDALKAFKSAKKRTSFDALLAGAQRLRDDPNRVDQFTPLGATWLNADGWEDEPLPSRSAGPSRAQEKEDHNMAILYDFAAGEQRGLM